MARPAALAALAALALAAGAGVAPAQVGPSSPVGGGFGGSAGSPTLSPYLGLLNGNNSTAFNYYAFVRPQQRFNAEVAQVDRSLSNLRTRVTETQSLLSRQPEVGARLVGATGHATAFQNTRGFFPNR